MWALLFAFYLGVELAFWSIALAQLTGHSEQGSWRRAINPPIVAIPAAVLLNALGAKSWIPASIETTIHLLAVCAIPMALLISGALIADHINKESLRHGSRAISHPPLYELVFCPRSSFSSRRLRPWTSLSNPCWAFKPQCPLPSFPSLSPGSHHGDMPTALQVVLGTSLIGLITIPLWIGFGLYWIIPGR